MAIRRCPPDDQMRGGQLGAAVVVDGDRVAVDAVRATVDEDHRQSGPVFADQVFVAMEAGISTRPSARRATRSATMSRSRSGSSSRLAASTDRPARRRESSSARSRPGREAVADVLQQCADDAGPGVLAAQGAGAEIVPVVEPLARHCSTRSRTSVDAPGSPLTTRDTVFDADSGQQRDVLHRGRAGRSPSDPDCVNVVVTSRSISDRGLDHKHSECVLFPTSTLT